MAFRKVVGRGLTEVEALASLRQSADFESTHFGLELNPEMEIITRQVSGVWVAIGQLVKPLDREEQQCYTDSAASKGGSCYT